MKGIAILLHSVRLVINHLETAFRVTIVPYAMIVGLNLYIETLTLPFAGIALGEGGPVPDGGFFLQLFLVAAVALVLSLWVAVAWHRFALNGEVSGGFVPNWMGDRIAAYFGRGLVLMLIAICVSVALSLALVPILPPAVASLIIVFWVLVFFFRMCAVLPAAAIGRDLTIAEAWRSTKGQSSTIIVLALVGGGAKLLLELPNMLEGGGGPIGFVYAAVVGWFTMVIGISVLTTFYGHFVEERPID